MICHVHDKFSTNFISYPSLFCFLTLRFLEKMDPGNSELGISNLASTEQFISDETH